MAENETVVEHEPVNQSVPMAAAAPMNVPEELPQHELKDARKKVGKGKYCVNCQHFNFGSVYGPKYGACGLRPRKESKVDVDYSCEEFSKA